jgi:HK97 family phage portal protein
MSILDSLNRAIFGGAYQFMATKQSQVNRLMSMFLHSGNMPPKDQRELDLAKEGYNQTGVVYACIREIAIAFSGIKWGLFKTVNGEREEILEHPMLTLWKRPNVHQGSATFLQSISTYYLIAGNSYIEANTNSLGVPQYLYCLRPDMMSVIPDVLNRIGGYRFTKGGQKIDFTDGEVMHFKDFHPTNDWYGLSPISVAALSVDSYKAQQRWNRNLLENSATPSGVLNFMDDITPETINRVMERLEETQMGPSNAKRPMIIEGGKVEWQELGLNAKELDYIKSQNLSALQIAQIFNVPPELIGLHPATYQNRKEARKALYTEVVLPMLDRFRDDLNGWLPPMFGEDYTFEPNLDDIEALQEDRDALWTRLKEAEDLTLNEKRVAKGYDEIENGDVVFVSANQIPLDEALDPFSNLPPTEEPDEDDDEDGKSDPFDGVEGGTLDPWNKQNKGKTFDEAKQARANRKEILALGRMRKKFTRRMMKDLKALFGKEKLKVLDALERFGLDAENNIIQEIDSTKDDWENLIVSNRLRIMKEFGKRSVASFKKSEPGFEVKASQEQIAVQQMRVAARLHVAELITNVSQTTKKKIRGIIEAGVAEGKALDVISAEISVAYKAFTKGRSNTIALTETVTAQNRGSLEAMNSLKIPLMKVWLWSGITGEHERTGHKDADGDAVQNDDYFRVSPDGSNFESLLHPGDPTASAGNRINCHCGLTYKRDVDNDDR